MIDNIVEFTCKPIKCLFNGEDYKIYGVYVDVVTYPNIKLGKYGTATIVGNIQELQHDIEYEIKAIEEENKYGYQYKVQNIRRQRLNTLESSRAFLYEIITPMQADTLLSVYPDIIDKIINDRLDDVDLNKTYNIKEYIFNVIKRKVIENYKLADIVEKFHGIFSFSIIKKLYDKYTSVEKIEESLKEEPYECLCSLNGVGFKTADKILLSEKATKLLFNSFDLKTSKQRMKACVKYILDENEQNGNTYLNVRVLKKQCDILAKEAIKHLADILKNDKDIYFNRDTLRVAHKSTYDIEKYISEKIKEGLKSNIVWDIDCNKYQNLSELTLTDKQLETLKYMCKYNIVLLNGNAGSGKSSSTKALINMLQDNNKSFILLAPTGRAAKVLSEYTNCPAFTIHRGLGFKPPNTWRNNEQNPLLYDVVIVDEASMVDVYIMQKLLQAIDFRKAKLLIIGDDAQLSSVGAGNILYDLLNSKAIPTVTLDKTFRYGEGGLMTVATDTRSGKRYLNPQNTSVQIFGNDKSYIYIPVKQEKLINNVVALYKKILSQGHGIEDVIILSSYNKGKYGTVVINNKIQEVINPNVNQSIKYGETEFRLNDPVIQCVNDYNATVYKDTFSDDLYNNETTFIPNGEIGKIVKIENNALIIDFDGTLIYCPKENMNNIKLAYAISIHKIQGSSSKIVILVTPKAHTYMLNANLLYVGETRASERCYHLGEMYTINNALKIKENYNRDTFLLDLLKM